MLINLVDHGMTIQQAVDAPRISVTTAVNSIAREAGFDEAEIAKLRALGHTVGNPGNIGNVNAIFIDPKTGRAVRRGRLDARGRADRPRAQEKAR